MDEYEAQRQLQQLHAHQQIAEAQLAKDLHTIAEVGRLNHGTQTYDQACETVADALGEKKFATMAALAQLDHPDRVVLDLAADERRLKEFAKLDQTRQLVEAARIESKWNAHGAPNVTGADRAWARPEARQGRVSDEQWARGGADHLSEAQWQREYERRQAQRRKAPR